MIFAIHLTHFGGEYNADGLNPIVCANLNILRQKKRVRHEKRREKKLSFFLLALRKVEPLLVPFFAVFCFKE